MEINESRILNVEYKVVNLGDVRKLARVINEEYVNLKSAEKDARIRFSASCFDGSRFSSKDVALFDDASVLSTKRVQSISVTFSSYDTGEDIDIDLTHEDRSGSYSNRIKVSGDNSTWVNGTLKRLEEVVESFTPQNTFLVRYRYIVNTILALGIGTMYFWVVSLFPSEPSENPPAWAKRMGEFLDQAPFLYYFIKYLVACGMGWFPALMLLDKLKTFWPTLEIQIGPEHTLIEKQRRAWVLGAILIGVVPLVTSFIYDVLKAFIETNGS